jgi:hypothetical protein
MDIIIFGYKPNEMKKLLLLSTFILLSVVGLNAQTWKHKVQYSDFDGKYDIVYAFGYGGSSPYENPQFIVRNRSEEELFISDLGHTGCDNNRLLIVFDRTRKYYAYGSPSTDRDALFISSFYTDDNINKLTIYHLLQEIMQSSKMSIRFSNDCTTRDFYYRLDGSTSALTKMFGSKIQNEAMKFDRQKDSIKLALEERNRMWAIRDSIWQFQSDSSREWRKNNISERKLISDSIINHFIHNPRIDGTTTQYTIQESAKSMIFELLKKNMNSLKDSDEFLGFNLQPTEQGYYKLMIIYRDSKDESFARYLYKAFDLTESGELVPY